MHGHIFQVSNKPIRDENRITEEVAYNDALMDYCTKEGTVTKAIQWIMNEVPGDTFKKGKNYLILKDVNPLLATWKKLIDSAYERLRNENYSYQANRYLVNVLEEPILGFLFFIDDCGDITGYSSRFVNWLTTLKPGDKIYFGSVFDYHF